MKLILLAIFAVFLAIWAIWHASAPRLWKWLGARPAGQFPVWRQVKERFDELARQQRVASPRLYILPEFSPNALVLRRRGLQVGLTEGLLRCLDSEELDAVLLLCLTQGGNPRRSLQTRLALQLFPFAHALQSYPAPIQVFLAPWLTAIMRLISAPAAVLRGDAQLGPREALALARALQKMAVLGRKIPFRHWNFAIDPLFLISPLALDGGPFWVFLSQPSVEERRQKLLDSALGAACESSAGLS